MYSCIPIVSHVCEYHVWIFLLTYAFVVYLRKLQCCVFFTSFTKCTCYIFALWFWTSLRINWVSTNHVWRNLVDWGAYLPLCQPIMLNLLFFLPVVKLAFFSVIFFPRYIYLMYIIHTHTPCLKCWWYVSHVKITWCLCKKVHADRPRPTIFGMVWLTKLSSQSSLNIGVLSGMLHVTVKFLISEFFVPSISI